MKHILLFFVLLTCLVSKSQTVLESDSLKSQVVFYIPEISVTQLNNIKSEFANYPQIQKAVYIYQAHKCLLVDLADVSNPRFVLYRDLLKIVAGYVGSDGVYLKTPAAYSEIMLNAGSDLSNFTVK